MSEFINNLFFAHTTQRVDNPNHINDLISFDELVSIVKSPAPANYTQIASAAINAINTGGKVSDSIAAIKKSLSSFLACGFTSVGHGKKPDFDYNGVMQIDIDYKELGGDALATLTKNILQKCPYIILAGISPSGVGVKALAITDNTDISQHTHVFDQIQTQMRIDLNDNMFVLDTCARNYGQPCYQFYDAAPYVNYDATPFHFDASKVELKVETKVKPAAVIIAAQPFKGTASTQDRILRRCLTKCLQKHPLGDTMTLVSFAGLVTNYGIDALTGYEFLMTSEISNNLTPKRKNSYFQICKKYAGDFGIFNKVVEDVKVAVAEEENDVSLSIDQYLTEIAGDIKIRSKTMIIAPTGSGKTHWVKGLSMKRIMVVPTIAMVDQVHADTLKNKKVVADTAARFYSKNKEATEKNQFIVTTYASLATLKEELGQAFNDYTIFFDEVHVFTSNSSKQFQYYALSAALNSIGKNKWVAMTATELFNFSAMLKPTYVYRINRKTGPDKQINIIEVNEDSTVIEQTINSVYDSRAAGNKSFIFVNNTDEAGIHGQLIAGLNANLISTAAINSKQNGTDEFNEIVIEGNMEQVDCIVATSILKEGISITKGFNETVDIYIVGKWAPMEIEQFANRARGVKNINGFIVRKARTEEKTVECFNDVNHVRERFAADAYKVRDSLNFIIEIGKSYYQKPSIEQMIETTGIRGIKFDKESGGVVCDDLLLSNAFYEFERNVANIDDAIMNRMLCAYGWTVGNKIAISQTVGNTTKRIMQLTATTAKDMKEIQRTKWMNEYSKLTVEVVKNVLDNPHVNSFTNPVEYEVAKTSAQIANIFEYDGSNDKVIKVMEIVGTNPAAIAKLRTVVGINTTLNSSNKDDLQYKVMIDIIQKIEIGKTITCKTAQQIVRASYTKIMGDNATVFKLNEKNIGELLKSIFNIKDVQKREGDTKSSAYRVTGMAFDKYKKIFNA